METHDNARRLDELMDVLSTRGRPFVLTHTNPDPDALASALGVQAILKERVGGAVPIAMSGMVGRAENKALVDHIGMKLLNIGEIQPRKTPVAALVDAQPDTGNVPALPDDIEIAAVFDHHPLRRGTRNVPFHDVRTEYGSTSTIVWEYLKAAEVPVTRKLATALFYGIKSDTHDLWRQVTEADERAYIELFTKVDRKLLASIENPTVPRAYFRYLQRALTEARLYDSVAVTDLARTEHPDVVAEVADMLLTVEGIEWTLASGWANGGFVFSIRARERHKRMDAGQLAQDLAHPLGGTAGGHGTMAAGRIDCRLKDAERIRRKVHRGFLQQLGANGRGKKLV